MSITREDILGLADRHEQMSMYEYWSEEDEQQHKDHVGKTPLEMVNEFSQTTKQNPNPFLYIDLIREEFIEWSEEAAKGHTNNFERWVPALELKELSDLVYVIYGYALSQGWNLDEAVRRVHENNMGRMYQPDGTIKRREDGKIIKNKDYPKVNLGDLV